MERAEFFDTYRPMAAHLGRMMAISVALAVAGNCVGQSLSPRTIVSGVPVSSVRLADMDQDQRPEVLLLLSDGGALVVHLDAEGAVLSESALTVGQATTLGVADFNASGALDLFFGFGGGNPLSVFLNDGTGLLESGTQTLTATEARSLGIGDLDGDGDSDVIVANGLAGPIPNKIWLNNGSALFTSGQELGLNVTADVEVADFDSDGDLDLWFSNPAASDELWNNDGVANFFAQAGLAGLGSTTAASGDLNGDGRVDLLLGFPGGGGVQALINSGDGIFSNSWSGLPSEGISVVELADLNGDSWPDLLVGSETVEGLQIFLGDGEGSFSPEGRLGDGSVISIAAADIELDGDLDLVTADRSGQTILWLNDQVFRIRALNLRDDGSIGVIHDSDETAYFVLSRGAEPNLLTERVSIALGQSGQGVLVDLAPSPDFAFYQVEKFFVGAPADLDGDGIHDLYELENSDLFDAFDPSDADRDSDGDGKSNREEFLEGSDPRTPESSLISVVGYSPAEGEDMVNVEREITVRFDGEIDPATADEDALQVIANNEVVPSRIEVSSTRRFVTLFPDSPLPPSTAVRLIVDGDRIRSLEGAPIDVDFDQKPGGDFRVDFRTVPLGGIPGTAVWGIVRDSQTEQPLEGVTISVDALPQISSVTDENGRFQLDDVPAPEFFVTINGATAAGPSEGRIYPSLGKAFHSVAGQVRQLEMDGEVFDIYLPSMSGNDIQPLSTTEITDVGFGESAKAELEQMFPELPPETWDRMEINFEPGAALDDSGNKANQALVLPVPPERIPAPIPAGLTTSLVVSIQAGTDGQFNSAGGATRFDRPPSVSFPNLSGLAPGQQNLIFWYDHTAGNWEVIGSGTVSADGTRIVSDPGVGIEAPGWGFIPDDPIKTPKLPPPCTPLYGLAISCGTYRALQIEGVAIGRRKLAVTDFSENPVVIFDFGPADSPVADGAIGVTNDSLYTVDSGFGWIPETDDEFSVISDDPGLPEPDLSRDFVRTSGITFSVEVPEGFYEVITLIGDVDSEIVHTGVAIEGVLLLNESTPKGQMLRSTVQVSVNDGMMDIRIGGLDRFDGQLSALEIRRLDVAKAPVLSEVSENMYYSFKNLDNGFTQRGQFTSFAQFFDEIFLAPDTSYEISFVNRDSLAYGSFTFSSPSSGGLSIAFPEIILEKRTVPDLDEDGLIDIAEQVIGTRADLADSDEDGVIDGAEVLQGLDPLDDRGFPNGIIAALPLRGNPQQVVVRAGTSGRGELIAYTANGSGGIASVDVSRFSQPVITSQVSLPGSVSGIDADLSRDLAVAAANTGGLHFLDVSDPLQPKLIETVPIVASGVLIRNGLVYASVRGAIYVYDLAGRVRLQILRVSDGMLSDLAAEGNHLFTIDEDDRVFSLRIQREGLETADSLSLSRTAGNIFVGGGVLYAPVVGRNGGYATVDVSDPTNLRLISGSDVPNTALAPGTDIALNGSGFALLVGGVNNDNVIDVMDVSDPAATNGFLTRYLAASNVGNVAIAGGIGFAVAGSSGFQVVNYFEFDALGQAPTIAISLEPALDPLEIEEGKPLLLSASVTDDVQVRSVEFYVNGNLHFIDVCYPFEFFFAAPSIADSGEVFTLQARAVDTGGNVGVSGNLTVDLTPDASGPFIVNSVPGSGALTSDAKAVILFFNEPLKSDSVRSEALQLLLSGDDSVLGAAEDRMIDPIAVSLRDDGLALVATYAGAFPPGLYEVRVEGLTDLVGNPMEGSGVVRFWITGIEDRDGDGIADSVEVAFGFDPENPDTDGNGISDGDEDLDGDGLNNRIELALELDPREADSDLDGIPDGEEDSDRDSLINTDELALLTNPILPDSDGDGWNDENEITVGSDPLDPTSLPSQVLVGGPITEVMIPTPLTDKGGVGTVYGRPIVEVKLPDPEVVGSDANPIVYGRPIVEVNLPTVTTNAGSSTKTMMGRPEVIVIIGEVQPLQ
jgi:hypothetical protein